MAWALTDALRAALEALPDDGFPDFRCAGGGAILAELPKTGAGLHVLCCRCWTDRWVGGRDICQRWPEWLLRPQIDWARALRCAGCGERRFAFHAVADPAANGFQTGPQDTAPIICARRLTAWLAGTGVTVDSLIDHLAAMPTRRELLAAGV